MKRHTFKGVMAGLGIGCLFLLLAAGVGLAIKFFFRIFGLLLEHPLEAFAFFAIALVVFVLVDILTSEIP